MQERTICTGLQANMARGDALADKSDILASVQLAGQ